LRKFNDPELDFIQRFKRAEIVVEAGSTIFSENAEHPHLYTILSGWAFRYKTLEDGRRQILNFALPSDLLGLQNAVLKQMRHSVEALTRMTLCVFNRKEVWPMYRDYPELALDVTWLAAREEVMLQDNLVSVGRRTAMERVAYVLLHLYCRAEHLGLTKDDKTYLPITQTHLADALGLSTVHTNKTIQKLTKLEVIRWRQGTFHMIDKDRLAEIALYRFDEDTPRPFL
jgi:CRP-like cAMP-binding protein